jgi:hypothetical protein
MHNIGSGYDSGPHHHYNLNRSQGRIGAGGGISSEEEKNHIIKVL